MLNNLKSSKKTAISTFVISLIVSCGTQETSSSFKGDLGSWSKTCIAPVTDGSVAAGEGVGGSSLRLHFRSVAILAQGCLVPSRGTLGPYELEGWRKRPAFLCAFQARRRGAVSFGRSVVPFATVGHGQDSRGRAGRRAGARALQQALREKARVRPRWIVPGPAPERMSASAWTRKWNWRRQGGTASAEL